MIGWKKNGGIPAARGRGAGGTSTCLTRSSLISISSVLSKISAHVSTISLLTSFISGYICRNLFGVSVGDSLARSRFHFASFCMNKLFDIGSTLSSKNHPRSQNFENSFTRTIRMSSGSFIEITG